MKVLKRLNEGKISYMNFENVETIQEPFINRSNSTQELNYLSLNSGSIDLNAFEFNTFILEVENLFVPQNEFEFGGITINRGSEKQSLYEYQNEGSGMVVPFIKMSKVGDVYTGYSSEDGLLWDDKGYIHYPCVDVASITVIGETPFNINKIKLYKEKFVYIYSLIPNWKVEVYQGTNLIQTKVSSEQYVKFELPVYPFNGSLRVLDEHNQLVTELHSSDIWGGDEYVCMANVEIRTIADEPLIYEHNRDLGRLDNSRIEEQFKVVNLSGEQQNITIRVAQYSPFGEWVTLSHDVDGVSSDYEEYLDVIVPPNGEVLFWLLIKRPYGFNLPGFNYKEEKCQFFLEVV